MNEHASSATVLARRAALVRLGSGVGAAVVADFLTSRGVAYAQTASDPTAALQLASRAISLQRAFYASGIATPLVFNALSAGERTAVQQTSKHEQAAETLIRTELGSNAPAIPTFTFTAGGAFPLVMDGRTEFLEVAQLLEDATVRLLKEQLRTLVGHPTETRMLGRLHQVQARHAAEMRRLRGQTAWITGASFDAGYGGAATTAGTQASVARLVYGAPVTVASQIAASEDNRVQAGLLGQRTDAFDEPMPAADGTAFLQLFGA